jgi:hypothetical protein
MAARNNRGVECPECGCPDTRAGSFPWYLGTVGAVVCRPVICEDCDHTFDAKKPKANLSKRLFNLAIVINGIGLLGILTVIGLLVLWIAVVMKK